jgi:hypothetical protein
LCKAVNRNLTGKISPLNRGPFERERQEILQPSRGLHAFCSLCFHCLECNNVESAERNRSVCVTNEYRANKVSGQKRQCQCVKRERKRLKRGSSIFPVGGPHGENLETIGSKAGNLSAEFNSCTIGFPFN